MPSLVLFGNKSLVGGDDLQPVSAVTLLVRALQFILLLPSALHLLADELLCDNNDNDNDNDYHDDTDVNTYTTNDEDYYYQIKTTADDVTEEDITSAAQLYPGILYAYVALCITFLLLSAYIEIHIYNISSIGSPTNTVAREQHNIARYVEYKLRHLSIFHAGVFAVGVIALHSARMHDDYHSSSCHDDDLILTTRRVWFIATAVLLASQAAETWIAFLGNAAVLFQSCIHRNRPTTNLAHNRYTDTNDSDDLQSIHGAVEDAWQHRCRNMCLCMARSTCYLFGGREIHDAGDYDQIARVLADYFEGLEGAHVDLVASDVVAGIVMLGRVQRLREVRRLVELKNHHIHLLDVVHHGDVSGGSGNSNSAAHMNMNTALLGRRGGGRSSTLNTNAATNNNNNNNNNKLRQRSRSPSNNNLNAHAHAHYNANLAQTLHQQYLNPNNTTTTHHDIFTIGGDSNSNSMGISSTNGSGNNNLAMTVRKEVPLQYSNPRDSEVIEEGARFARHALAIYTWMLYGYMKPCTGLCSLISFRCFRMRNSNPDKSCCCALCSHTTTTTTVNDNNNTDDIQRSISNDNLCSLHEAALLKHAGLNQSELVYAQFQSSLTTNHTPYAITIDHKWKCVVLSIRGTLSLEDCVTDVLVDPVHLEDFGRRWSTKDNTNNNNNTNGFLKGEFAHSGVISCSEWILQDLERHGLLDRLLLSNNNNSNSNPNLLTNYKLRICGHSLGAGCAVLISFILKQKYPTQLVRCLAYSPPGGLVTQKLATECSDYVHSFVLDSDLVPRLSVQTMELLRDEVLELIARIKVPKILIAQSLANLSSINGYINGYEDEDSNDIQEEEDHLNCYLHPKDDIPDSEFKRQLERLKRVQQRRRDDFRGPSVCLYPPGKIVHLTKIQESNSCVHGCFKCLTCGTTNFGSEYTPVYVGNDRFNEIVISPTMGTDHFPNRVCVELERIASDMFGLDVRDHQQPQHVDGDACSTCTEMDGPYHWHEGHLRRLYDNNV